MSIYIRAQSWGDVVVPAGRKPPRISRREGGQFTGAVPLAEPLAKLLQAALLWRFLQLFAEVAPANGCSGRSSQFWIGRQNVSAEEAQSKLELCAI